MRSDAVFGSLGSAQRLLIRPPPTAVPTPSTVASAVVVESVECPAKAWTEGSGTTSRASKPVGSLSEHAS